MPLFAEEIGVGGWIAIIVAICTGIAGVITPILTAILAYLRERNAAELKLESDRLASEVRAEQSKKLDKVLETQDGITGKILQIGATSARALADSTGSKSDEELAMSADTRLEDHKAQVPAKNGDQK